MSNRPSSTATNYIRHHCDKLVFLPPPSREEWKWAEISDKVRLSPAKLKNKGIITKVGKDSSGVNIWRTDSDSWEKIIEYSKGN